MVKKISELTFEDVLKVYSGREGCRCGCLGQYRTSTLAREEAGKERGYPYDDKSVNNSQVKSVLKQVQASEKIEVTDGNILNVVVGETANGVDKVRIVYLRANITVE